jgi:cellulose synthase/poly-beta-1,6-N-acetylglucosamine synthase-like glycosyltransferase
MLFIPVYLLIVVVVTNRYFAGLFFRLLRRERFDEALVGYEPSVAVVVPMYNEGPGIYDTIVSLLAQEYPAHKLVVMVVDDCSTDDSYTWARKAERQNPERVRVLRNPHNMGKRRGILHAVRELDAEIIVSVDSDVVVDRRAVRELVARFVSPEIAAVGGRVSVINPHENWLTRMQTIKYHFGYFYLKNLERAFRSVLCLSGCLTAYRRHVLIELEPVLEDRNILGVPIKYGEDRFLTRQIVKAGYQTLTTLDARCWTVAPNTVAKYLSQQLRWRRSNFVDFMLGIGHVHRLHPCVSLHYYSLFALQVTYPLMLVQSLWQGKFWALSAVHLMVLGGLGAVYYMDTRQLPEAERVHPLWFLSLGVVMPVTYLVQNILAFWTLDSGSWETRNHVASEPALDGLALERVTADGVSLERGSVLPAPSGSRSRGPAAAAAQAWSSRAK